MKPANAGQVPPFPVSLSGSSPSAKSPRTIAGVKAAIWAEVSSTEVNLRRGRVANRPAAVGATVVEARPAVTPDAGASFFAAGAVEEAWPEASVPHAVRASALMAIADKEEVVKRDIAEPFGFKKVSEECAGR